MWLLVAVGVHAECMTMEQGEHAHRWKRYTEIVYIQNLLESLKNHEQPINNPLILVS